MKLPLLFLTLALFACGPTAESEGQRAEDELHFVATSGPSGDEVCAATRKVADGYLHDRNAEEYKRWDLEADITCRVAAYDR